MKKVRLKSRVDDIITVRYIESELDTWKIAHISDKTKKDFLKNSDFSIIVPDYNKQYIKNGTTIIPDKKIYPHAVQFLEKKIYYFLSGND